MKENLKRETEQGRLSKEAYELWWEYLRRSEAYRTFCELMKKLQKNEDEDYFEVYERVEKKCMSLVKTKKQKEEQYQRCYSLLRYWEKYGDIQNSSLQSWLDRSKYARQKKSVIDLTQPNPKKLPLHKIIRNKMPFDNNEYFYVAVPIYGNATINEIADQISTMRQGYQNNDDSGLREYMKQYREPIGRVRIDELKRYLKVYDLKTEGKKIREIAQHIGKDRASVNETRRIFSDIKKAKTIINNVENGRFPGEYQS